MKIPLFQIDAFTDTVFRGNPAAVCPMEKWPAEAVMQSIAAENNVPETAFFVGGEGRFKLRWFTPVQEVDLCGHATLAAAWVIFNFMDKKLAKVSFSTKSGALSVTRAGQGMLAMDFPARPAEPVKAPEALVAGLGAEPAEVLAARDYLCVFESEKQVRALKPDMGRLRELDRMGVIATARGDTVDFVSRFFAPKVGIPEDPVTGSAHCTLVPYWTDRLGKDQLHAQQVSRRGGELFCIARGMRVVIAGRAVLYMRGAVDLPLKGEKEKKA
jgi:PhzF family phenazine biosynthesis protein